MIHYTGDVHQPLHGTARVDDAYPEGDRGGNSFKLPSKGGAKNLHAVWDSIAYFQNGYAVLPLSDADWDDIGSNAAELVEKYPLTTKGSDLASLNPHVWAYDSFEISRDFLYLDIKENEDLSQDYIDKARALAEKQVVRGGYRLAHLLMDIYGPNKDKFLF